MTEAHIATAFTVVGLIVVFTGMGALVHCAIEAENRCRDRGGLMVQGKCLAVKEIK